MPNPIPFRYRIALPVTKFIQTYCNPEAGNRALAKMNARLKFKGKATRVRESVGGVNCDVFTPLGKPGAAGGSNGKVLVYIHGGGFVFAQTPVHLKYCASLCQRLGAKVIAIDYSLDSHPAGLNDCLSVYRELLDSGTDPACIAVAGDSAGGCYTLTLILKLKELGLPLPAAAAAISPVVNADTASLDPDIVDLILSRRGCNKYSERYIGQADARDPLISPLYGDFSGACPILVHSGEREILLLAVREFAKRALEKGYDITLKVFEGMFHVFTIREDVAQGKQSSDEICAFVGERWGSNKASQRQ